MPPIIRTIEALVIRLQSLQRNLLFVEEDLEDDSYFVQDEPDPYGGWVRWSEIDEILEDLDWDDA